VAAGVFAVFLVLTSTTVQTRVIQRTGVKPLVLLGMALGAVAMVLFAQLTPSSSFRSAVLPGLLITGVGMGCIFAPAISAPTLRMAPNEAGIASAMANTSQQIGGSVGTSLPSTIYATAVTSYLASHPHVQGLASAAQVHGDTTAFWWAVEIFGLGGSFIFTTGTVAIVTAAVISLIAHFLVGAAKSLVTLRSWWSAGLEMTLAGVIGGGATYLVGLALPT
jgi:MFS family permease